MLSGIGYAAAMAWIFPFQIFHNLSTSDGQMVWNFWFGPSPQSQQLRRFHENRCAEKAMWAGQLPEELRPRPPFAAVFEDLTC